MEKRRVLERKETNDELVKCQMDKLIVATDENGKKLYDNKAIIDLLLGLLHAGHHTPAYTAMWAIVQISQNSHIFQKAKVKLIKYFLLFHFSPFFMCDIFQLLVLE